MTHFYKVHRGPATFVLARYTQGSNIIELQPLRYHTAEAATSAMFALHRALRYQPNTATASR
jgi:hypothetical protein